MMLQNKVEIWILKVWYDMEYFLLFLEGIITFISPCILPLLPLYISYFAGGNEGGSRSKYSALVNLLTYSISLGIPFVLCAILIDGLKDAFNFIKRNYEVINKVSGIILVIIGFSIMTGYLNKILSLLTF